MEGCVAPDYVDCYPPLSDVWKSGTNFDLGWISGLHNVANKSLKQIYGDFDQFKLDPENPLEFGELNVDEFASDSVGPIIYITIWIVVLVVIAIWSVCWCCRNKCCCCCRSSFQGRKGRSIDELENTDPNYQLRPYYSERNDKTFAGTSVNAIVLSILMAIWLIGFLIMILHTFASNDKTKDAIDSIQPDLDNAFDDINSYLEGIRKQLSYSFVDAFEMFDNKIKEIVTAFDCLGDNVCENFKITLDEKVNESMDNTKTILGESSTSLGDAIEEIQNGMVDTKTDLDDKFEDTLTQINNGLHWFFMFCNVFYCIIFGLVLIGTVLATFARGTDIKTIGYLLIRGAIVLMFIFAIMAIVQLIAMFLVAGVTSRIICPAIREFELEPDSAKEIHPLNIKFLINSTGAFKLRQEGEYEVPDIGQILRSCKADHSVYDAFRLNQVFNPEDLKEIADNFDNALQPPPGLEPAVRVKELIVDSVQKYVNFVDDAIQKRMGKCLPVYNSINATLNLFCEKMPSPVASFWWILQFIPPTFILILITAMFSERLHT